MASSENDTPPPSPPQPDFSSSKNGLYGAEFDPTGLGLNPNVLALIEGPFWTSNFTDYQFGGSVSATRITYGFIVDPNYQDPDTATFRASYNYPSDYGFGQQLLAAYQPATTEQQAAVATAFNLIAAYTLLAPVLLPDGQAAGANLRYAGLDANAPQNSSWGVFPPNPGAANQAAGDGWFAANGSVVQDYFGTDGFNTIIHEIGHTLGLKHGHTASPNGMLAPQFNDNEFSVMTYASYFGANTATATEAVAGSSPQSYMMFDIAALQELYGANFGKVGTSDTYTWDNVTGQEYVNKQIAPNTGVSSTHKIFSTVWTAGATSTYDLSNFSQNQVDDMRPGKWMTFSDGQLAQLNANDPNNPAYKAQGNIYNALLYHNNLSSLIDNLKTGSGNDTITGNDKGNHIDSGAGNDSIQGGNGDDVITGGPGHDIIDTGRGYDTIRDTPANMDGDYVNNFGQYLAVDYVGIRVGLSKIGIVVEGSETTFKVGGSALQLNGNPVGGVYFADERGTTPDTMHTTVKFVPYLPSLQEGVAVNGNSINSVIDRSFLTGDGNVHFTATLEQAVSSFHNELGIYQIGPDGTISSVHMLFGNTLGASNATVDLGTPGNGVQIGFFLVQDGFTKFGALPNDLSFVMQGAPGAAATINAGQGMLELQSATLGILNGATVFFSSSQLNPGGLNQVLSGTDAAGHDLHLGFEDMGFNAGDRDFQDVVLRIHSNADLLYGA